MVPGCFFSLDFGQSAKFKMARRTSEEPKSPLALMVHLSAHRVQLRSLHTIHDKLTQTPFRQERYSKCRPSTQLRPPEWM